MKLRSNTKPIFDSHKPLIFQITDWYAYDGNNIDDDDDDEDQVSDNESVKSDDSDNENTYKKKKDTKKYYIRIFGVDSLNQSISVLIKDFPPYFFVKVPDTWGEKQLNLFSDVIRDKISNWCSTISLLDGAEKYKVVIKK
jgi:hypothetical protein